MAETFGALLRRFRKRKGWTTTELAEAVGAGRKSVTDWEAGRRVPRDRARLEDLAQVLGLGQAESEQFFAVARGAPLPEDDGVAAQAPVVSDAEARYLNDLITRLEQRKGVLAYVELAAQADAPADERRSPSVMEEWGLDIEFALLEVPRSDDPTVERRKVPLTNILEAVQQHHRFVLIGDPGAGKTTTLQRLVLEATRACQADSTASLPLLLTLPNWRDEPTPAAFIRAQWPLAGDPLPLLKQGGVRLYLDGLNEMGAEGPRKAQLLRDWLRAPDGPKHVIITCRAGDYAGDLALDLPTVVAEPLDKKRIEQFATTYLGEKAVSFLASLWSHGDWDRHDARHLFHLARNPYLLTALLFVYRQSPTGDLPRNTGLLFQYLIAALWERERIRQTIGWVPLAKMQTAFAALAFVMIDRGRSVSIPQSWATQQIAELGLEDADTSKSLFHVGQRANILLVQDNQLQFSHQLLQEYFAALALAERGVSTRLIPPRFASYGRVTDRWDQAIVSLCGIVPDIDATIVAIAATDPFLAADCVRSGVSIASETRRDLIERLLYALRDPKWRACWAAALRLGQIGSAAVPGLLDALHDPRWGTREAAANALGQIRDGAAVSGLVEALRDHQEKVRKAAADALGQIRDEAAVSGLLNSLHDPDENVRQAAALALMRIGDVVAVPGLLDALHDSNKYVRRNVTWALGKIGHAVAVPGLLNALRDPEEDVRRVAAVALGWVGDAAVPGLLEALSDPNRLVRHIAAVALRRIDTPDAKAAVAAWRQVQKASE